MHIRDLLCHYGCIYLLITAFFRFSTKGISFTPSNKSFPAKNLATLSSLLLRYKPVNMLSLSKKRSRISLATFSCAAPLARALQSLFLNCLRQSHVLPLAILAQRISGAGRETIFVHYFGNMLPKRARNKCAISARWSSASRKKPFKCL